MLYTVTGSSLSLDNISGIAISSMTESDQMPEDSVDRSREPKTCAACGRTIEWRKKWARDWPQVRYCSDACRHRKPGPQDTALEQAILTLLAQRGAGKTICPSEAARSLAGDARERWEPLMEPARAAARRLVASGRIAITQGGRVIDPSHAKGPIRLKLV